MADKGIFDIIGSGVQKILGNPYVQGMGLMAATGFNPAIGVLAGSVIKNDRDRSRLENDALRARIDAERDRLNAANEFDNLVTSRRDQYVPPMPLLGIDGTSPGTVGDFMRSVPALETPGGMNEAMGLWGRMAPAAAANAFAGSMGGGRDSAKIQQVKQIAEWRAQGRDAEADLLEQSMLTAANPYASMVDRLRMEQLMDQIARDRREDTRSETERGQSDVLDASQVRTSIDQLIELGGLNEQLAGTFQATGLPAPEARETLGSLGGAVGNVLGIENTLQEDAAAKGLFNKYKSQLQFDLLKDAEVGSRAANIANQFFKGTVGEIGSAANSIVIADQIEGRLRYADAMGIDIPPEQRAKAEAAVEYYRELGKQGTGQKENPGGVDFTFDGQNVN